MYYEIFQEFTRENCLALTTQTFLCPLSGQNRMSDIIEYCEND